MTSLPARIRCDSGQAFVLVAAVLMVLVGMAALVIDGGSWYRAQRHLQTAADAAALAGAQELPTQPSAARTVARDYVQRNYAGIPDPSVELPDPATIDVSATATAPGIFARVYGATFDEVDISARAQAQVRAPLSLKHVAPIVVRENHPLINGKLECPCFNQLTEIPYGKGDLPGNFGLISLDGNDASPGELESWIKDGYDGYLKLGNYDGETGAKFNSDSMKDAMGSQIGKELLFPVYDDTGDGNGDKASYHVIGWIAFHLTAYDPSGSSGSITGYFTDFTATDLAGDTRPLDPDNDFGVRVITLTN